MERLAIPYKGPNERHQDRPRQGPHRGKEIKACLARRRLIAACKRYRNGGSSKERSLRECSVSWRSRKSSSAFRPISRCCATAFS